MADSTAMEEVENGLSGFGGLELGLSRVGTKGGGTEEEVGASEGRWERRRGAGVVRHGLLSSSYVSYPLFSFSITERFIERNENGSKATGYS